MVNEVAVAIACHLRPSPAKGAGAVPQHPATRARESVRAVGLIVVGHPLVTRSYGVSTLQLAYRDRLNGDRPPWTLCIIPLFLMIYQIKLQYGFVVDATNQADALNKAVKMIRDNPSSHISSVFQASAPRKRKRSLLVRILKGA